MSGVLSDRVVVVTGAAGALGGAVVRALVGRGARCHTPLRGSAGTFPLAGDSAVNVAERVDLTDERQVTSFYESLPGLWASVHCAGAFAMAPIAGTSAEDLRRMMSANLRSAFLCCREAVRRIRAGGEEGRVVNVAARPALEPRSGSGMVAYAAAKAAVAALTQALAEEVAAERIWVNAVAPSILDTPANRAAMPDADFSRWPSPDDAAATIADLISPANRSARGAILPVYGSA